MDNKSYFDSQEFRDILRKYEQARANNASLYFGIDDLFDILCYYLFQEAIDAAVDVYGQARALHPDAPELTKMEVKILLTQDEPEKALMILGEKGFPADEESKLLHAQILIALKGYKEAREIAIEILNQRKVTKEIACEALEIMLDGGFAQEALQITDYALSKAPGCRNFLEVKAECLIELQDTNSAIDIYNELLDCDPYSTFYWEQLARIYYMTNRYGKALECFEYELAIGEEIDYARMMQGYCYYFLRDYKKAAKQFATLNNKYTSSVIPPFYKALCLWHEGKADEALAVFEQIIGHSDDDSIEAMVARINKAIILSKRGNEEEAVTTISFAMFTHPENIKQLLVGDEELYCLRDKENLTFKEMNVMEIKDWGQDEVFFALGVHLIKHGHYRIGKRVLLHARHLAKDSSDIDAEIAYAMVCMGEGENILPYVEIALKGRSNLLFDLFGLVYDANITVEGFLNAIKK